MGCFKSKPDDSEQIIGRGPGGALPPLPASLIKEFEEMTVDQYNYMKQTVTPEQIETRKAHELKWLNDSAHREAETAIFTQKFQQYDVNRDNLLTLDEYKNWLKDVKERDRAKGVWWDDRPLDDFYYKMLNKVMPYRDGVTMEDMFRFIPVYMAKMKELHEQGESLPEALIKEICDLALEQHIYMKQRISPEQIVARDARSKKWLHDQAHRESEIRLWTQMFEQHDVNCDGLLTLAEYKNWLKEVQDREHAKGSWWDDRDLLVVYYTMLNKVNPSRDGLTMAEMFRWYAVYMDKNKQLLEYDEAPESFPVSLTKETQDFAIEQFNYMKQTISRQQIVARKARSEKWRNDQAFMEAEVQLFNQKFQQYDVDRDDLLTLAEYKNWLNDVKDRELATGAWWDDRHLEEVYYKMLNKVNPYRDGLTMEDMLRWYAVYVAKDKELEEQGESLPAALIKEICDLALEQHIYMKQRISPEQIVARDARSKKFLYDSAHRESETRLWTQKFHEYDMNRDGLHNLAEYKSFFNYVKDREHALGSWWDDRPLEEVYYAMMNKVNPSRDGCTMEDMLRLYAVYMDKNKQLMEYDESPESLPMYLMKEIQDFTAEQYNYMKQTISRDQIVLKHARSEKWRNDQAHRESETRIFTQRFQQYDVNRDDLLTFQEYKNFVKDVKQRERDQGVWFDDRKTEDDTYRIMNKVNPYRDGCSMEDFLKFIGVWMEKMKQMDE